MIKKLILFILLSLCVALQASAWNPMITTSGKSGAAVVDSCAGSLHHSWHMEDNTGAPELTPDVTVGGPPTGCSDTDAIGAVVGTAPAFVSDYYSDGALSIDLDALDEAFTFTANIAADDSKVTFDLYIVSYAAAGNYGDIMRIVYDANNQVIIRISDTSVIGFIRGGGTDDQIAISPSTGTWLNCEYQVKDGVDGNDHYINCSGTSAEEDDDVGTFASNATAIEVGDRYGDGPADVRLDNLYIYAGSDRW